MAIAGDTYGDTELLNGARKALFERSRLLAPDGTLAAIQDLKLWVGEELSFEEGASASFGRLLSELWHSEYLDQLPPLLNRFERLVCAYFVRRGSVTAFHGFCNAWREGVFRRILLFAEEGPELHDQGHPPVPYALLASGSLGRREQTFEETDRYFLVWSAGEAGYFDLFAYRIMAILEQAGLVARDGPGTVARVLWRGSLEEWEVLASAPGDGDDPSSRMEFLSDLRHVCGDETVGREATRIGRAHLDRCRGDEEYPALARHVVATPVALDVLRVKRVKRSGEQAGRFNPDQSALQPLLGAVRLLAVRHGLDPGPTLDRLSALRSFGILEEELVARLEAAYHLLAGLKIGKEIALEQPCMNPALLTPGERQNLKAALEAVRQLQDVVTRTLPGKSRENKAALNVKAMIQRFYRFRDGAGKCPLRKGAL